MSVSWHSAEFTDEQVEYAAEAVRKGTCAVRLLSLFRVRMLTDIKKGRCAGQGCGSPWRRKEDRTAAPGSQDCEESRNAG